VLPGRNVKPSLTMKDSLQHEFVTTNVTMTTRQAAT